MQFCTGWWANLEPGQPNFPPLPPHQLQNIISIRTSSKYANEIFLREHYLEKGLSVAQIGALTFSSKQTVLKHLRKHGISIREDDVQRNPRYGQRRIGGRIRQSFKAQRIQQKATLLRGKGFSYHRIAQQLNQQMLTPGTNTKWHAASVRKVIKRHVAQIQ